MTDEALALSQIWPILRLFTFPKMKVKMIDYPRNR
jgi:hypothetical protein